MMQAPAEGVPRAINNQPIRIFVSYLDCPVVAIVSVLVYSPSVHTSGRTYRLTLLMYGVSYLVLAETARLPK